MFKFLLLVLLGFFIFRYLRQSLFGGGPKKEVPRREKGSVEKPFQEKHRNEIEDADFEDLD